jgi:hypothetical protein
MLWQKNVLRNWKGENIRLLMTTASFITQAKSREAEINETRLIFQEVHQTGAGLIVRRTLRIYRSIFAQLMLRVRFPLKLLIAVHRACQLNIHTCMQNNCQIFYLCNLYLQLITAAAAVASKRTYSLRVCIAKILQVQIGKSSLIITTYVRWKLN